MSVAVSAAMARRRPGGAVILVSRSARTRQDQLLTLAMRQYQDGSLEQAEHLAGKLLRRAPDHFAALCLTARVALARGQHDKAMQIVRRILERFPNRAEPYVIAGEVAHASGRVHQADAWYRKALAAPEGDASSAWVAVGRMALDRFDSETAVTAFRKALELTPDDDEIESALADALATHGLARQAVPHYESVLARKPENHAVRTRYAATLRQLGRFDEADDHYAQVLRHAPTSNRAIIGMIELQLALNNHGKAHALAQQAIDSGVRHPELTVSYARLLQRAGRLNDAIACITGHLRDDAMMPAGYRSILHMTLASLYEKAGQYDTAFVHYRTGNDLNPRRFSASEYAEFIGTIIKAFAVDRMQTIPSGTCTSDLPIFIVGMPRSGTSLTEQILGCHPDVYAAGELNLFHQLALELPAVLDTDRPYPECISQMNAEALDRLARQYLDHVKQLAGDRPVLRITDKMPHNFMHLGLIRRVFPRARVIHVMRHPLDTCFSIYATRLSPAHTYAHRLEDIAAAYTQYRRLMTHWQHALVGDGATTLPESDWMYTLRYEDLVANPEPQIRRLLDHCGLPWDARCLEFHKSERIVMTASMDQVRQPLNAGSLNRHIRFERYLRDIEAMLSDFIIDWNSHQ